MQEDAIRPNVSQVGLKQAHILYLYVLWIAECRICKKISMVSFLKIQTYILYTLIFLQLVILKKYLTTS